jgi:3-methyl-2-oxobutanoate hydroxymethyltransferase
MNPQAEGPRVAVSNERTTAAVPAMAAADGRPPAAAAGTAQGGAPQPLYGGTSSGRRITVRDIAAAKARGEKWPMLTAYDALSAHIFDEAGIPVLLVGDSAAMVVFGHDTTIPVTLDDLIPLTAAVVRGTSRAMVIADLPFGSYQASSRDALSAAARFMKESGAHAIKLEGGQRIARQVEDLVAAGVPVMAHLGLTPQSVHAFGGYRVQGRGEDGERLLHDAKTLEAAGAFGVVLECVPAALAARVTTALSIPTIGIGAGPDCDAQVLVWQDMAGLSPRTPKFVRKYADVTSVLDEAASAYARDVVSGAFPGPQESYRLPAGIRCTYPHISRPTTAW